jgi:hypothetical protein
MDMLNRRMLTIALLFAVAGLPSPAHAQRIAITAGAGALGDRAAVPPTTFSAPVFTVSVQRVMRTHFVLEGELAHWFQTTRHEQGPHNINGPGGVLGQVSRSTESSSHRMWNLGMNLLVQSTGPVRVFGGGGLSFSMDDSEYVQQSFDCSPSLDPRVCSRYVNSRLRGPIPLIRALGGVEVPVTETLGVFAAVRTETASWEEQRSLLSGVAGVRFFMR